MGHDVKSVMPIKDKDVQRQFAEYFESTSERNYVLYMSGIYLGLRISDLLRLRVHDVRGTHVEIKEQKNSNNRKIFINKKLRKVLDDYIEDKAGNELLFVSQRKGPTGKPKALTRYGATKVLKNAAVAIGYNEPIATHSLRKTFAYNLYVMFGNVPDIQEILGHEREEETRRYLGLVQESQDEKIASL